MAAANPSIRHRSQTGGTPRVNPDLLRQLASRLTPRDHQVLELVWQHRVLTTHQLTAIVFPRARTARDRLLELHRYAALERFQPWTPVGSLPAHWVLGPAGAHVIAARRGIALGKLGYRRTTTLTIAHSTKLAHQIGVNEFFTQLHAHARRHGHTGAVARWWPERRCAALWGDLARPDAYGRWVVPLGGHRVAFDFFLEHDTGSETLQRVAGKLAGYAALAESTGITTPVLLWLPSAAREVNLREVLGNPEVPVATAVHTPSTDPQGPAGPVWLPAGSTGPRMRLAELARLWPVTHAVSSAADAGEQQDHAAEDRDDHQNHQDDHREHHQEHWDHYTGGPEHPRDRRDSSSGHEHRTGNHPENAQDRRDPYKDRPPSTGHHDGER